MYLHNTITIARIRATVLYSGVPEGGASCSKKCLRHCLLPAPRNLYLPGLPLTLDT
jgi:hypothetical protein